MRSPQPLGFQGHQVIQECHQHPGSLPRPPSLTAHADYEGVLQLIRPPLPHPAADGRCGRLIALGGHHLDGDHQRFAGPLAASNLVSRRSIPLMDPRPPTIDHQRHANRYPLWPSPRDGIRQRLLIPGRSSDPPLGFFGGARHRRFANFLSVAVTIAGRLRRGRRRRGAPPGIRSRGATCCRSERDKKERDGALDQAS